MMKDIFLIFAKQNGEANGAIVSILNGLSNEDREKDRGSYYGSLSGLARHILVGTSFFLGMFKETLGKNPAALKAIAAVEGLKAPEGTLNEAQWKTAAAAIKTADEALVNLAAALREEDLALPVAVNWFGGNPATMPLSYMLQALTLHGAHHRGQVSQILDSLKIDNNYSGINAAFLSR
jgi:uncharacterized damage-inducible protein DinB